MGRSPSRPPPGGDRPRPGGRGSRGAAGRVPCRPGRGVRGPARVGLRGRLAIQRDPRRPPPGPGRGGSVGPPPREGERDPDRVPFHLVDPLEGDLPGLSRWGERDVDGLRAIGRVESGRCPDLEASPAGSDARTTTVPSAPSVRVTCRVRRACGSRAGRPRRAAIAHVPLSLAASPPGSAGASGRAARPAGLIGGGPRRRPGGPGPPGRPRRRRR